MAGHQPAAAAAAPPAVDQHLRMAKAIMIGMKGATAAKNEEEEKVASHEKVKILAACSLHQRQVGQSAIHLQQDCQRQKNALGRQGRHAGTGVPGDNDGLRIPFFFVLVLSPHLTFNGKDLKFGGKGSSFFESCHRGTSLFSVPSSFIEVYQWLRAWEEDAELAMAMSALQ